MTQCSKFQKKLCGSTACNTCFIRSFASSEHINLWSHEKNIDCNPTKISKSSHVKYWFTCKTCKHDYDMALNNVKANYGCAYCDNKKLCSSNECQICFDKSFASHAKIAFWSNDNSLSPRQVFKASNIKYKFNCTICFHQFETQLCSFSTSNSTGCLFCANLKLCDDENCQICFDKSVASHSKAKVWSSNDKYTPRQIFKITNYKALFDCDTCKHEFIQTVCEATRTINSTCPYCNSHKLCNNNNCDLCFKKSFASHEKAVYWHDDNIIKARLVCKNSHVKYKFTCNECKETFMMCPAHINREKSWCSNCKNKTESKLLKWLNDNYKNIGISNNINFEWCKSSTNKRFYPFDFVIEDYKLIIELDGVQHFEHVKCFKNTLSENQDRDIYKMKQANENGYSVIRVFQEDVFKNKNNWDQKLKESIKRYDQPICIYLETNSKYTYQAIKDKIQQIL